MKENEIVVCFTAHTYETGCRQQGCTRFYLNPDVLETRSRW